MKTAGFWDYIDRWQQIFKNQPDLDWTGKWLKNSWCGKCQYCCGPQDNAYPFPMPLLKSQKDKNTPDNFYLLDSQTPYLGKKGCKSDSAFGCRLPSDKKPIACGLFPIVLANGRLYLYQQCPAVIFTPLIEFLKLGKKVAEFLSAYSFEELRRISLWLNCENLSRSYIDLRIQIFNDHGKDLIYE